MCWLLKKKKEKSEPAESIPRNIIEEIFFKNFKFSITVFNKCQNIIAVADFV